jgi:hypothetical protein
MHAFRRVNKHPCPLSRGAKQIFSMGITTDYAIERDDIGVSKRGCHRGEIADDELSGT